MLQIERHHAQEMFAHALKEDPNECCGILAGKSDIVSHLYRITNTAKSPYRYLMDPQGQLNAMVDAERNGLDFIAFYHSHTHGPAYPSATDVRLSQQLSWPNIYYVLVSLENKTEPDIKAYLISDTGSIEDQGLEIIPN